MTILGLVACQFQIFASVRQDSNIPQHLLDELWIHLWKLLFNFIEFVV